MKFSETELTFHRDRLAFNSRTNDEISGFWSMMNRFKRLDGNCLLACLVDIGRGKIHLLDGEEIVIGRSSECNIHIKDDSSLSRKHASISLLNGEYFIQDLGSRNGTILNSKNVGGIKVKLKPDDKIIVGKSCYSFSPVGISEAIYGFNNESMPFSTRLKLKIKALRVSASSKCHLLGFTRLSKWLMPAKESNLAVRKLQSVTEPILPTTSDLPKKISNQ